LYFHAVLPRAGRRVAEHRAGVPVGLHVESGLEDVLDDPEPLTGVDAEHLEQVAAPDVDEGEVIGADVDRDGKLVSCSHALNRTT
jgi:hypothetical protein